MRIQEFKLDTGSWQTKTSKERSVLESETGFEMVFQAVQTDRGISSPAAEVQTQEGSRPRTEAADRRLPGTRRKETMKEEEAPEAESVSSKPVEAENPAELPEAVEEIPASDDLDVPEETRDAAVPEEPQGEEMWNPDFYPIFTETAVQEVPENVPAEGDMAGEGILPADGAANTQAETEGEPRAVLSAAEMEIPVETNHAKEGEEQNVLRSLEPESETVNVPKGQEEGKPAADAAAKQDLPKRQAAVPQEQAASTGGSTAMAESAGSHAVQAAEVLPNEPDMTEKTLKPAEAVIDLEEGGMDSGNETQEPPREDAVRIEAAVKGRRQIGEDTGNPPMNSPLAEGTSRQAAVKKEPVNSTPSSQTFLEFAVPAEPAPEALPAVQTGKQQPQTLPDLTVSHVVHAERQVTVEMPKTGAVSGNPAAGETPAQANLDRVVKAAQTAIRGGSSSVQLRLDPPELGLLRVEIRHSASGLHLQMQATSTEAHQMLQKSSHELRAALEMQGLGAAKIEIQLRLDLRNESSEQGSSNGQSYPQSGQQDGQSQSFQSPFSQDFGSEYRQGGYDSGLESTESETGEAAFSGAIAGRGDGWQETQFYRLDVQV